MTTILLIGFILCFLAISAIIFKEEINGGIDCYTAQKKKKKEDKEKRRQEKIEQTSRAIQATPLTPAIHRLQYLRSPMVAVSGVIDMRTLGGIPEAPASMKYVNRYEQTEFVYPRRLRAQNGHQISPQGSPSNQDRFYESMRLANQIMQGMERRGRDTVESREEYNKLMATGEKKFNKKKEKKESRNINFRKL